MGSCTTKPVDKRKQNLYESQTKHKSERNNEKQQEVEGQQSHGYGEVVVNVEMDHCNEGVEQMQFNDFKRDFDNKEVNYNNIEGSSIAGTVVGVPKCVASSGQKSSQAAAKRSNSCGGKQEDELTLKTGVQGKNQKQTAASFDQQSTTAFTGAHNDIFSKKDCTSSSETATTKNSKQKRCLMQSTHEQTGITLMIFEPTQNSVNEDENEGSFSINEMVEEENQEEEEENKDEKDKKLGQEEVTNKQINNQLHLGALIKTKACDHNGINQQNE